MNAVWGLGKNQAREIPSLMSYWSVTNNVLVNELEVIDPKG